MSWENPKTTWGQAGQTVPGVDDFNRIEGNIDILGKYDRAPGYGTATGTNTKAITLSPAPSSYYEGLCFAFKNSTQNTGAVTINVNGLGAKAIKKPNGNNLVSGNLKAGSVYTVRYNGTNFILQGSDSSGDAMPEHVLAGKIFSNDSDTDITGTMPNRGSVIITPSTTNQAIASGYHSGSGYVKGDPNLVAGNIKKGKNIFGVNGSFFTGTLYLPKIIPNEFMVEGCKSDGTFSVLSSYIRLDAIYSADHVATVTDIAIDLTNFDTVLVEWVTLYDSYGKSYLIASTEKMGDYTVYDAKLEITYEAARNHIYSELDISGLSGNYYIRVHSRRPPDGHMNQLEVYKLLLF